MWEIDWASGDSIDLKPIERREDVTGDAAHGDGFPRTDDEVGEHHHPPGGEADGAGKSRGGVRDLPRSIGHGGHQPAIDPADREKECATDGEAQQSAQCAAAQQPIVHHDQPADADHCPPAQGEVVGEAKFSG
ncbi:MAG: hypothetical protein ABSF22_27150 [Bryobacteraceae bacterium]